MVRKTGIHYIDKLSPAERKEALTNMKLFQASLSPEERGKILDSFYQQIREIRRKDPLLTANLSDEDIGRNMLNAVDFDGVK